MCVTSLPIQGASALDRTCDTQWSREILRGRPSRRIASGYRRSTGAAAPVIGRTGRGRSRREGITSRNQSALTLECPLLQKAESRERPHPKERLADDVRTRDGAPEPTVTGVGPVVAHHVVVVRLNRELLDRRVELGPVG